MSKIVQRRALPRRRIRTVLTDKGRPSADLPRNRSGHTMPMRRLRGADAPTPAHAAGEIARLMKAVPGGTDAARRTPAIEPPLDPALKRALRSSIAGWLASCRMTHAAYEQQDREPNYPKRKKPDPRIRKRNGCSSRSRSCSA